MEDSRKQLSSIIVSVSIALFIVASNLDFASDLFTDSFFWNLLIVPIVLLGCGFIVALVVLLPSVLVYCFFTFLEETNEHNGRKSAITFFIIAIILVLLALTLFVTAIR